jgi:cytochrome d ubiquinol oxidase subunit I
MDLTALLLSPLQFAFTISFHIIFPSFTIGLAAWLTVLEALHLGTGRPAYRAVFEFWLKIFGVAFGLGVVSGIVMAFQFGTNWSVMARMAAGIQGVPLSYETFTAFFLEASFFGILLFGRPRVAPWFYLFSTAMVALGTALSAYWIMANNSWMQVPVGYVIQNGTYVSDDWSKIIFSPVLWVRFPHMLIASYLTGAFCAAATGAWYLLRREFTAEGQIMLRMGLYLAVVLVPVQIYFGHLTGDYVHNYQPVKFAAIEGRWHDEQTAGEVLLAIPDPTTETNKYEIKVPVLGSLIGSMSFTSKEVGLTDFPPQDRDAAWRQIPYLVVGVLVFLVIVFAYALAENLPLMNRWLERPYLFVFPAISAAAAVVLAVSVRRRRDGWPFYMVAMVALIFLSAFGTLAISFWPYMIPFVVTVDEAAATHSSLAFMFWGEDLFIFPLMLVYTAVSYSVFRGKVRSAAEH